jgi:predicted Rossmann fold nucleotide-binding protein DprA/Smf involved in DNA uptake
LRTNPAAQLVTSVADMIDLMTGNLPDERFDTRDSSETVRVLDALASTPKDLTAIAARAGISEATAKVLLTNLEREGRVGYHETGWTRRATK